jgi:hypothetical protein
MAGLTEREDRAVRDLANRLRKRLGERLLEMKCSRRSPTLSSNTTCFSTFTSWL